MASVFEEEEETVGRGFERRVGFKGVQISGGQKQRIAIARAIIRNPSILLLDEATSALDADTEARVHRALSEKMIDRTSIIIAHRSIIKILSYFRLSTIRNTDCIFLLQNGKVVEKGNHQQLMQNKNHYYNLIMGAKEI